MKIAACMALHLTFLFLFLSFDSRKPSLPPIVSQPETGAVYTNSVKAYEPPKLDSAPAVSEPYGQLQSGGFSRGDAALRMTNNLGDPAYVKVVDGYGATRATIYLRTGETYEMRIDAGSYAIRYVSGPGSEWRGATHYFGSRSSFSAGSTDYIGPSQILSLTFTKVRVRAGEVTNVRKINEQEF